MSKYGKPLRKVGDHEISPYKGFGGKKQMQRAQSRKRTQIRNAERFNSAFGWWIYPLIIGVIAAMGVVAFVMEM